MVHNNSLNLLRQKRVCSFTAVEKNNVI